MDGCLRAVLMVVMTFLSVGSAQEATGTDANCPISIPTAQCNCLQSDPASQTVDLYRCDSLPPAAPTSQVIPALGAYDGIITKLEIFRSNIRTVQAGSFLDLKIRGLYLVGLGIIDLEREAFSGLEIFLEILNLSDNNLVSIPERLFSTLYVLQELHLDYNRLTSIQPEWFSGLRNLRYLFLDHNDIAVVAPQALFDMPVLIWLKINNNKLNVVPADTYSQLEALEQLDLKNNSISLIDPLAYKGMRNLMDLDMSNNLITSLDVNVFDTNFNLARLDLSGNQLHDIPDSIFNSTRRLDVLDLANNSLTSFRKEVFGDIRRNEQGNAESLVLRILVLNDNKIGTMPNSPFVNLNKLDILLLQNNLLTELPYNNLAGLSELTELHLDGNQIQVLTFGIFDQVGNLKRLKLGNNQIYDVQANPFDAVRNLVILDLSNNLIPRVTQDWFSTSNGKLESLFLDNNLIEYIEDGSFSTLVNLKELNLENNQISEIKDGTFINNSAIHTLKFSNNPIRVVEPFAFKGLSSLQKLYAERTCWKTIENNVFYPVRELKELYLSRSPVRDLPSNAFRGLTGLLKLGMSYTNLTNIDSDAFGHLLRLKELQLDHSKLNSYLVNTILAAAHNLTELDLSHNLITYLNEGDIKKMVMLRKLLLKGNPLDCRCDMVFLRSQESLDYKEAACHTPQTDRVYLAACFSRPPMCSGSHVTAPVVQLRCSESPYAYGPNVNPPTDTEDYDQCIIHTTTAAPTTVMTTTVPTTTVPPVPKLTVSMSTVNQTIFISWNSINHPYVFGYRILHRRFAFNDTKSQLIKGWDSTGGRLEGLIPGENYVVCVYVVTLDAEGFAGKAHEDCQEVRTHGVATPAPKPSVPTEKNLIPVTIREEPVPLVPIIVACGVAVVIIIVIIVLTVVVQSMRKRQNQMKKLEEEQTASSMSLRQKLGMWATTFNYTGANNEQMAEQTTLTWNIYSSDDYIKPSHPELQKTPEIVMTDTHPYENIKLEY